MSPVNTIEEIRAVITAWADDRPLIERIVLFGSRARGDHQPDSDFDLAIVVSAQEGSTTGGTYFAYRREWKRELEEVHEWEISLVHDDPNGDPEIQANIHNDGITVYARSDA
jgi:predicted nucleotidyltransferase